MAGTYAVGEGALRIFPNFEGFHRKVQAEIQKEQSRIDELKVDVEVNYKEFKKQVDRVRRDLKEIDGDAVSVDILVDTEDAWLAYKRLQRDIDANPLRARLVMDKSGFADAHAKMKAFKESHDTLDMFLDVHRNEADEELRDFYEKHNNTDIRYRVIVDHTSIPALPTGDPALPDPSETARKIEQEWNSINFIPKLLKLMDAQFEAGVRQIYDPYVNSVVDMARKMREPFEKLNKFMGEQTNFKGLFDDVASSWKTGVAKASRQVSHFRMQLSSANPVIAELKSNLAGMKGLFSGFRLPPELVQLRALVAGGAQDSASGFKASAEAFADWATDIQGHIGRLKRAIGSIGDLSHAAGDRVLLAIRLEHQRLSRMLDVLSSFGFKLDFKNLIPQDFTQHLTAQLVGGFGDLKAKLNGAISGPLGSITEYTRHRAGVWQRAGRELSEDIISGITDSRVWQVAGNTITSVVNSRIVGGIRRGLEGFTSGSRRLGNNFVSAVLPSLTRAGAGLTRAFAGWAGRSEFLFRGLRLGFARAGAYVAGFGRIALGTFTRMAAIIGSAVIPAVLALGAGLAALGGQAILGGILALAGALVSVAKGAALVAPALVAAAGVSFVALKIGLTDVKTAIGSAFSSKTIEEFESSIKDMPASVQAVAREMRGFKEVVDTIKFRTQDTLLADLGPSMSAAMNNLLPSLGAGLEGVASAWNGALRTAFAELSSAEAHNGVSIIMQNMVSMANAMQPVLANLIAGLGSLAEQGSKFLEPLGSYFAEASLRFREWAESLKAIDPSTGMSKFDMVIQDAVRNAGYLSDIFGGIFGTIGNILHAAQEGGGGMLAGMAAGAQELKRATEEGSAGFAQIVEFMHSASAAASQLGLVLGPALGVATSVGSILAGFAYEAIPGLGVALQGLQEGLAPIKGIADEVGAGFGRLLATVGPVVAELGNAIAPLIQGVMAGLEAAGTGLMQALLPIVESLSPAMQALMPAFETVGKALGDIFIALSPVVESSINVITAVLPVVTHVLDLIGQIGVKIIEVLAPLFTGHDSVITQLVQSLMPLADVLGNAILQILNALAPVMPVISDGLGQILQALLPLIPPLAEVIQRLGQGLADAINWVLPLIPPLIDIIVSLVKVAVEALALALNVLLTVWDAVWPSLNATMTFLFRDVIAPLLSITADNFRHTADLIKWLVEHIINPALDFMGFVFKNNINTIKWTIENILSPALDFMKNVFSKATEGVRQIWDGVKKIFADPIKFFVEVVVNKGIVDTWNHINDKFLGGKLTALNPVNVPAGLAFARGGVMPGYTPGRDPHKFYSPTAGYLQLSGGEAIMRPEWTRAVGGPQAVEAMNKKARQGGVRGVQQMLGQGAAYARGGVVDLDERIAGLFDALKSEHGKPYQYGGTGNPSWDCSGLWSGITQYLNGGDLRGGRIFNTESAFEQFGFTPGLTGRVTIGIMRGGGGPNSHMAGTIDGVNIESAGDHGVQIGGAARGSDHSMFGIHYTLSDFLGEFVSGGNGGTGGGFFSRLFNKIKEKIAGAFDPLRDQMKGFSGLWGQAAGAIANKVLDGVKDFIMSKIPFGGGAGSYDGAGGISGDVESWREMAQEAMRRNGFNADDPAQVQAMLKQIQSESRGDPNISQQIVDRNGTGDAAGVGLLQIIPGTFADYRDPSLPNDRRDPWANMNAALRYYKARYGTDLTTMWGHGHGYDSGGEALGIGYMPKYTLQPERVLSPNQTRAFNDFVYKLMPQLIEDWRKQPYDFNEGIRRLTAGVQAIHGDMLRRRDERVDALTESIAEGFRQREAGTLQTNPVDLGKVFEGNQDELNKLNANIGKALGATAEAAYDPAAYLKAEELAKEKVEKEKDEAHKKAQEERREARQKERDALNEAQKKEREAEKKAAEDKKLSEEEKKAISERHKAEDEALKKRQDEEEKELQKQEQAEDERIRKLKETGEYYYGYKTLSDNGDNPYKTEETTEEKVAKETVSKVGEAAGLGGLAAKALEFYDVVKSTGEELAYAIPAWQAAANGDPAGLAHNVAVISAKQDAELKSDLEAFIPGAVGALIETAASGSVSAGRSAPFIGTINSGMSRGELINTMNYYQAKEARRRGSVRTR